MEKRIRSKKIWKWISLGFISFLILIVALAYLLQHFYGEKWVKQYVQNLIIQESDSLYSIKIKELNLNLIAGRLTISGVELIPDTIIYQKLKMKGDAPLFLITIKVGMLRVRGFETIRAIRFKDISVSKILIDDPEVILTRMILPDTVITDTAEMVKRLSLPLPEGLNSVVVHLLKITKGKFTWTDKAKTPIRSIEIPDVGLEVADFRQGKEDRNVGRIFNADNIIVIIKDFTFNTPDSLYSISLQKFSISSKERNISLDSVKIVPLLSRVDFFKKLGYQTDRFDVVLAKINVEKIDYANLLLNNIYHASYVTIDGMKADIYRDKRYPQQAGYRPPLPQDAIRKIGPDLIVDSLKLINGYAAYLEQIQDEPGMIFFDNINATAYNITNDSTMWRDNILEIVGSAMLMGKGHLKAHFSLPLYTKNNTFSFSGSLSPPFELVEINPMLTKLAPAKIVKGQLDKMIIPVVNANDDESSGSLTFQYHDLNVSTSQENLTNWQKIKTGAVNIAANMVIQNTNPSKNGILRKGIIHFERDKTKGFINFIWKSTFSGIKSTMGINDKEQRQTKKELRQQKREEKKKKR